MDPNRPRFSFNAPGSTTPKGAPSPFSFNPGADGVKKNLFGTQSQDDAPLPSSGTIPSGMGGGSFSNLLNSDSPAPAPSAFGGGGGMFSRPPAAQGNTNIFGGNTVSGQSGKTSLFGNPQPATVTGSSRVFGAPPAASKPAVSGLFGNPPPSQGATTNLFGAPPQQPPQQTGGMFAPKPATASSLFGNAGPKAPTSDLFGAATGPTNAFGAPKPVQSSLFGGSKEPATSSQSNLFSAPAEKPAAPGTTNLFGAAQKPASTTNLFGNADKPTSTTTTSSNLFGGPTISTAPTSNSNLFGLQPSTTTSSGPSLFAAKTDSAPAPSGLFSAQPKPPSDLFGAQPKPAAPNPFTNALGGLNDNKSKPTAPASLFDELGKESSSKAESQPLLFGNKPAAAPPTFAPAAAKQSLFGSKPAFDTSTPAKPGQPLPTPRTGGSAFDQMSFFDSQSGKTTGPEGKEKPLEQDLFGQQQPALGNRFGIGAGIKPGEPQQESRSSGGFQFNQNNILGDFGSGASSYADILQSGDGMEYSAHSFAEEDSQDDLRISKYYYVANPIEEQDITPKPEAVPLTIPNPDEFLQHNPEQLIVTVHELIKDIHGEGSRNNSDGDTTPTRYNRKNPGQQNKRIDAQFLRSLKTAAVESNSQPMEEAYNLLALMIPLYKEQDSGALADGNIRDIYRRWAIDGKVSKEFLRPVLNTKPSPASSEDFWYAAEKLIVIGEVGDLITLLSKAEFGRVVDENGHPYYRKQEVNLIEQALAAMVRLLKEVPTSNSIGKWRVWRQSLVQYQEEMHSMAHPPTMHEEEVDEADFYLRRTGVATRGIGFAGKKKADDARGSKATRPRLPADFESQLDKIYSMLRGEGELVYPIAGGWEVALAHKVTWDRYEEDPYAQHAHQRPGYNSFRNKHAITNKMNLPTHPLDFLKKSFKIVTAEFPLDVTDPFQLAIGHAICGEWKAVVDIFVKEWNMLAVGAFLVEFSKHIGWTGAYDAQEMPPAKRNDARTRLEAIFAESTATRESPALVEKDVEIDAKSVPWSDRILAKYAIALMCLSDLSANNTELQAWEVSMALLKRLRSQSWADSLRKALIPQAPLNSAQTVDDLLAFCAKRRLHAESRTIALRFATTAPLPPLGQRLKYLSAAGDFTTLHTLIQTLSLLSLRQSRPYPDHEALDPYLATLLSEPPSDPALRHLLAGYSVLREFLTWKCSRDASVSSPTTANFYDTSEDDDEDFQPGAERLLALIRGSKERIAQNGALNTRLVAVEPWILPALLRELLPFLFTGKKPQAFEQIPLEVSQLLDVLATMEPFKHSRGARNLAEKVLRFLDKGKFLHDDADTAMELDAQDENDKSQDAEKVFARVVRTIESGKLGGVEGSDSKAKGWSLEELERVVRIGIARALGRGWLEGGF